MPEAPLGKGVGIDTSCPDVVWGKGIRNNMVGANTVGKDFKQDISVRP